MHFGLFTYGSRGDVQPYIALALGLINRGHQVTLAAPQNFKYFVEDYGIAFHALHGNTEEIVYSPECLEVIKSGSDLAFVRFFIKIQHNIRYELFSSIINGCKAVDAVIANNVGCMQVSIAAEHLHKKLLIVQLNPPAIPTSAFALPGFDFINYQWYNKLTYRIMQRVVWRMAKPDLIEFRQLLRLPPFEQTIFKNLTDQKIPILHAFSEELIKRPTDWESHYPVTGFLTLNKSTRKSNATDTIPQDLVNWLQAGEKPVYIGFGSIPIPDPDRLSQIIQHLLTHTNHRILFCVGWSHIPNLPHHKNLFVVSSVNHQWLFPQCKTAIIHGGIGTLTAVLQAGIPPIVVSLFVDQPIWGKIIARKKAGMHLPWRKLNAQGLVKAIAETSTSVLTLQAATMREKLNREDGVINAVNYIEGYFV
ncbi:glycosyltransferase [Mucilaginibacter terrae]|uniref:glycosyltransferase n=1 Tax=Mucilaginibacter terrae TaxID=1955052 RepID=UPI00362A7995